MAAYQAFKKSEQRELAQQIAADLNDGITRERHAEIAATVLTSDWLAAHDRQVAANALTDAADDAQGQFNEQGGIGFARVPTDWLRARAVSLVPGNPEPTEGQATT